MRTDLGNLDPDLVAVVARHSGCPPESLASWTHVVFDLGIDGEDIELLCHDIETRFEFVATDAEWQSLSSLGDVDAMVERLRGKSRPDVAAVIEADARDARWRKRLAAALVLTCCVAGSVAYVLARGVFIVWVLATLAVLLSLQMWRMLRAIRARRRWKRPPSPAGRKAPEC